MTFLIIIVLFAVFFDFTNGFHDAANSIATIVSTKVLTPLQAVLWAAVFNFVAFFIFRQHKVAGTIADIISSDIINFKVLLAATLAAISWNLLTWYYGIPSSSSHTLIGGLIGAAIAGGASLHSVNAAPVEKALIFMVLSPIIGLVLACLVTIMVMNLSRKSRPSKAQGWFKKLQLVSSAALSLAHGGGDSQKTMGLILAALWFFDKTNGHTGPIRSYDMPDWLPLLCYSAIALGTMAGGWRIVKTMGTRITKVTPLEGVCAEGAGAITLFLTIAFGIPVSTTHTITGSIVGVGLTKRVSAVKWGVTLNLVWAWILTIPASALIAAIFYYLIRLF